MVGVIYCLQALWHVSVRFQLQLYPFWIPGTTLLMHILSEGGPMTWISSRIFLYLISMQVKVLNISLRFLFAILILEFICLVNVSLLSIMTPRSFSDSTFSIGSSSWSFLMVYVWFMSWFPKCICLHFLKLKNIFHSTDQSIELLTAHCNCVTSAMHVTVWYIFASSAKSFFEGLDY